MRRIFKTLALALTISVAGVATAAAQGFLVDRQAAKRFATMPAGAPFPEGVTANPGNGDIYVSTFNGPDSRILRFDKTGALIAQTGALGAPILGLAFGADGKVYYCNVGNFVGLASKIQRIDADLDEGSIADVANVPAIGAPADLTVGNPDGSADVIDFGDFAAVPNDLTFNGAGDLFFSDSFQGAVFRIDDPAANTCPGGSGCVETVVHDGRLATVGFPPFGANGVAVSPDDENLLFVANTGDDVVYSLDLSSTAADKGLAVFANSLNGADGIAFDAGGNLWVAANQADEMAVLNGTGRVIGKFGDFLGVREDGAVKGLVFPASLVVHAGRVFVTNLALDLDGKGVEGGITTHTVSRLNVPNFDGAAD